MTIFDLIFLIFFDFVRVLQLNLGYLRNLIWVQLYSLLFCLHFEYVSMIWQNLVSDFK